jgi:phenylalanyl-tRNA synthetase beta chain
VSDSKQVLCSLPPIINGEHSKIRVSTRNVFIEATGTDLTKLNVVLNTVVTMFSQYCAKPFTVEPVRVVYEGKDNAAFDYPDLRTRPVKVHIDYINRGIGIDMAADKMAAILTKVQLAARQDAKQPGVLDVDVPVTRSDVLHPCDIMEDVAIAYGYNNIVKTLPKSHTVGRQQPLNKLSDLVRSCIAQCGYSEVLTWILCSHDENFKNMNLYHDYTHAQHAGTSD